MSLKAVIFALPLLSAQQICLAQDLVKKGLPCVAEICLGDGIAELSKVQWDRAKNPFSNPQKPLYTSTHKISEGEMNILQSRFRGDLVQAAPYLYKNLFDSVALSSMARVAAACEWNELIGTYTTQSGNPTRVGISMTASQADTSKQQWTVMSIVRTFPAAVSNEQKAQVEAQLTERYHAFGANNWNIQNPKQGEGRFSFNRGSSFGFTMTLFGGIEEMNRMKLHPACGGTTKVKID